MKKYLLIIVVIIIVFTGCEKKNNEVVIEEPEIIELDEKQFNKIKLKTLDGGTPFIIKSFEKISDDYYSDYVIEVYDTKTNMIWSLIWRDIEKTSEPIEFSYTINEDKIIANIDGIITVHDLLLGTFLWEVETMNKTTSFYIENNQLYVLYYMEDFLTVFDLSNGKQTSIIPINKKYLNMTNIKIKDEEILIYDNTKIKKNGIVYNLEGEFKKIISYETKSINEKIIRWEKVEASSGVELINNIIDGSIEKIWYEDKKGYGLKEWIEITRALPTLVNELVIYNGDHSSEKSYEENSKVKLISVSIGGGKSFKYIFDNFEYGKPTKIKFLKPITADYIIFTINEVEPGTMYKNTTISEIYTK